MTRLADLGRRLSRHFGGRRRRSIPCIQQTVAGECGIACLAMVLAQHGRRIDLDALRDLVGAGRDSTSALALVESARRVGLRGRGVRVQQIDDLAYLGPGTLLHWRFDHWVVLESLTRLGAVLLDPALGRRHVSRDELDRSFTGVALAFRPGPDFERGDQRRPLGLRHYVGRVASERAMLARVLTLSVLVQILGLAVPIATGVLVDRVVPQGDHRLLVILAAGLGSIVLFNLASSFLRAHCVLALRTRLDTELTLDFLEHLVDLPYPFFQRRSAGDLLMRLNSNATIREILTSSAVSGILDGVLVLLYFAILFSSHLGMALLVVGLGALRVGLFLVTKQKYRDLMTELLQAQAVSRNEQVQMLAGIETLKSMGAERRAVERWTHLFVDELNVSLEKGRLSAIFDSLLGALGGASPMIVLLYGATAVLDGSLSLGLMLALSALAVGVLGPLSTLVSTALQLQLLGSYLERIDDVLKTPVEQNDPLRQATPTLRGGIRLEGVDFRYAPASPEVIRGVSTEIEPGSFVALVGRSGSGKTTLAHLLLGLYRPTGGRITFDGVDLATLDLRSLRRQLGIVPQQPFLFGTSIRRNIALADPTLPLSRVEEAARLAQIHNDIAAMPLGYDSLVADGGRSLSGGQRQRLALARALVRRPAILLLDEATSALDAVTERQIQTSLEAMACTRIVIAHRLSTIARADTILVLDDGRIVEHGDHATLLARAGPYAELVDAQLRHHERPPTAAPRSVARLPDPLSGPPHPLGVGAELASAREA